MAAQENKKTKNTAKVLVFAPPQICFHQPYKKARIEKTEAQELWDKINFHFDGTKYVKTAPIDPPKHVDTGSSESSCIFLDYDPKLVQEWVNSYLDQEFSDPSQIGTITDTATRASSTGAASLDKLQLEFNTVNFESQVLLNSINVNEKQSALTGDRPEVTRKKGETAVLSHCENTHQMTEDDVYTQQQTPDAVAESTAGSGQTNVKSSSSSSSKETSTLVETSPEAQKEVAKPTARVQPSSNKSRVPMRACGLPKISHKLSNLAECTKLNELVNLCFVVLQVNPVKEIQIKSGRNAGQFIPLSSIIVSDVTKSDFKLTLWRQASGWNEKIAPGDILVATSIRIEKWREEYIGQTTFYSSFYNLHQPLKPLSGDWLQLVTQDHLDKLMAWAKKVYGYLFRKTVTSSVKVVKYTSVKDLQNNTLVHFRGVLKSVSALTGKTLKNTYKFGSQRLPKITAIFAQSAEEEVCVTLWGRQSQWFDSLRKANGTVWELQYLTAKHDSSSGTIVLHTTPKSTKKKLENDNELAKPLLSLLNDIPANIKTFSNIKELLEEKFDAAAEVNGHIQSMTFRSAENEVLEVQSGHDVEALWDWCHCLTYVGCATCSRALTQDKNKIYSQCAYCVFHKPGYNYAVEQYFRNITIQIKDADAAIDVNCDHKSACKLFRGIEAKHLGQHTNNQLPSKGREFLEIVGKLFSCDQMYKFTLSCHTALDENSFVMSRTFKMLDFVQSNS